MTNVLTGDLCCAPLLDSLPTTHDAERAALVFSALSDPTRLRLFSLIATSGEACSCNLEGPLQKSQPTISHHTKVLSEVGLIVGTRRGKWMWWSINKEQLAEVTRILGDV